jgi:hypothetical protein
VDADLAALESLLHALARHTRAAEAALDEPVVGDLALAVRATAAPGEDVLHALPEVSRDERLVLAGWTFP